MTEKVDKVIEKIVEKTPRPKVEEMTVSFRLGENEGNPAEFTHEGKSYTIYNGEQVRLPLEVIEHLNGLKYPQHEFRRDEATGQMVSKLVGYKHRFYCIPIDVRQVAEK